MLRDVGHVDVGGPPRSWTVDTAGGPTEVVKLAVGRLDNNVYVVRRPTPRTGGADVVVVDAAAEADRILGLLHDGDRVGALVTTHRHADHWQALAEVARATGAPTCAGEHDAGRIGVDIDRRLTHGDLVTAGDLALEVLHTPGHTPGSICLRLPADDADRLLTGDTLFPGGPGATGDSEAFATIMRSLRTVVFPLPDDVRVHPGHGDDTTLGAERGSLTEWEERGW